MIYTAPIESITWQVVEDFLARGVKEGSALEYKSGWTDQIARSIAAMANTVGGVILVGVQEAPDGSPKLPPVGLPFERGMAERVTDIVLGNVTPPVFPDVQVCLDTTQTKAVVVIRVPQSHQTPHAIAGNAQVYLRTGNVNKPEDLATISDIGWLQERRAKSLEMRNAMYQNAVDRSDFLMGYTKRPYPGTRVPILGSKPYLLLCAAPYYPREVFTSPPKLRALIHEIRVPEYYGTDANREFPIGGSQSALKLLQDGVYTLAKTKGETGGRMFYTELGISGSVFYRQTLRYRGSGDQFIRATEIFARLDEFLRLTKNYVNKIGYQGTVWFHALMGSLGGSSLGTWEPGDQTFSVGPCNDEAIAFESSLRASDWDAESELAMGDAAAKIAWAYDWEMPLQTVRKYLNTQRRV
jgi:hypothetical protein